MEPERRIEKLLRSCAEKRRAGAGEPLKLHPANRRLLQDEVSRRAPKAEPEELSISRWQCLRRRWVYTVGLAFLILLGATVLLSVFNSTKHEQQSANTLGSKALSPVPERENVVPTASKNSPQLQSAMWQKELLTAANGQNPASPVIAGTTSETAGMKRPEPAMSAPVASGAGTLTLRPATNAVSLPTLAVNLPPAPAPLAATIPAPPASLPAVESEAATTQELFYRNVLLAQAPSGQSVFHYASPRAKSDTLRMETFDKLSGEPAQLASILSHFEVQQSGDFIRIVDDDGSVYSGKLRPANAVAQNATTVQQMPAANLAPASEKAVLPPGGSPPVLQEVAFRVVGMNRTWKQKVVFNGNLIAISNALTNTRQSVAGRGGFALTSPPAAVPAQQLNLSRSRIVGTAVIGGTNKIEIKALPSAP